MLKNGKWIEKRDKHQHPSVRKMTNKGMMYISTPKEIDAMIKKVPKGKLITTEQIAEKLAKKHKVHFTCPLTTGIFVSINANAAMQERAQGKKQITPYWRVIKKKGRLYDKYLGTPSDQKILLKKERHKVKSSKVKAAKYEIEDFEKALAK